MALDPDSTMASAARAQWDGNKPRPTARGTTGDAFWKVFHGDSAAVLKRLPSESINCIVTSPAYYWQRDYGVDGQYGKEDTPDGFVENLVAVFREARRVLRNDGTMFLNLGDTYYSAKGRPHGTDPKHKSRRMAELRAVDGPGLGMPRKSLIGIPWRVALALQADQWTLRSEIIWARKSSIPEPTAKDRPWRSHEHIFQFSKSPRYFFNRDGLDDEEDIWYIEPDRNAKSRGAHYAPYPRDLVRRCLEVGCPPAGVVLDPFAGGGTTIYEAVESGRSAVGIDLNADFCSLIRDNMKDLAPPGRVLSLPEPTIESDRSQARFG